MRQVDREHAAASWLADDIDGTVDLAHDTVHERQPQAGADAHVLGGEERVEDALDRCGRHADARVRDRQRDVVDGVQVPRRDGARRSNARDLERHGQRTALQHGLHRVHGQVHQHLVDLRGISKNCGGAGMEAPFQAHVIGQAGFDEIQHLANDVLDMHQHALADPAAAERQDSVHERSPAFSGGEHAVDVPMESRALGNAAQCHLAVAKDRTEDVVEIVRDSACERADGLELLGVAQLVFEALHFALRGLAIRDVADHAIEHGALARVRRLHLVVQPTKGAVRAEHPVFDLDAFIASGMHAPHRRVDEVPVIGMDNLEPTASQAQESLGRQPGDAFHDR